MTAPQSSTEQVESHRCIFCGQDATSSVAEAHIVPLALLATDVTDSGERLVLPPGWECDRCNSRFGSKLESHFMQANIGILSRLMAVPNRRGKYVPIRPPRGSLFTTQDGTQHRPKELRVTPSATSPAEPQRIGTPQRFNMAFKIAPKPELTSALLSKMLIEYVALQLGREVARNAILDAHRDNAIRPSRTGYLPFYQKAHTRTDSLKRRAAIELDLQSDSFCFAFAGYELATFLSPANLNGRPEVPTFHRYAP